MFKLFNVVIAASLAASSLCSCSAISGVSPDTWDRLVDLGLEMVRTAKDAGADVKAAEYAVKEAELLQETADSIEDDGPAK